MNQNHLMKKRLQRPITIIVEAALNLGGGILYLLFDLLGWPFVYRIGWIVGRLAYYFAPGRREQVEAELGRLYGPDVDTAKIRAITKKSFENYYKRHVETLFFGRLDRGKIEKIVTVKGIENIDLALSKGRGVILLLSHFGSFLLPLPFLGFRKYKVNQITGRQMHASFLAGKIWEWRSREAARLPVSFIQVDRFLRPVFQAVKRNELVAIAFDGRDAANWAEVDFFGTTASFSTGPFELARRTGAAIIPTFMVRRDDDTHLLVLEKPFALVPATDEKAAAVNDTRVFAKLFADYVGRHPCHFGMVLHKLYEQTDKDRKDGLPLQQEV